MNRHIPGEVAAIYTDFLACCAQALGHSLMALYTTGSIARGAYLPARSDVDALVILTDDWRERCDSALLTQSWNAFQALHPHTNLQFQYASVRYMLDHMPFVDVVDWQQHGILIFGTEVRGSLPHFSREMLQLDILLGFIDRYIGVCEKGRLLPYGWDSSREGPTYCRHPSMIALWATQPARILYTWDTGAIASKPESVEWFIQKHAGPSGAWMKEVLMWRETGFPDTESRVMEWGPKTPVLTTRFAEFLWDRISGRDTHFDETISERPLAATMSDLCQFANRWLASVPECQRYQPLML